MLPANATAYARYLVGNMVADKMDTKIQGSGMNVADLSPSVRSVLNQAIENAKKNNRSYVVYQDYPKLADGSDVNQFVSGIRDEAGITDLISRSFTDPVFEAATLLGRFNFTTSENGSHNISDVYNFSAVEGAGKKDSYSKIRTAMGRDEKYSFRVGGVLPAENTNLGTAVARANKFFQDVDPQKYVDGLMDTLESNFMKAGKLTEENVALPVLAFLKEGVARLQQVDPEVLTGTMDDIDFPDFARIPDVLRNMAFEVRPSGVAGVDAGMRFVDRMSIEDPSMPQLDIDINIADKFDRVGNILDFPMNFDAPKIKFPTAILSDEMLDDTLAKTKALFDGVPKREGVDALTFGRAFSKSRQEGLKTFTWRGREYTTQLAEEVDGEDTSMAT